MREDEVEALQSEVIDGRVAVRERGEVQRSGSLATFACGEAAEHAARKMTNDVISGSRCRGREQAQDEL